MRRNRKRSVKRGINRGGNRFKTTSLSGGNSVFQKRNNKVQEYPNESWGKIWDKSGSRSKNFYEQRAIRDGSLKSRSDEFITDRIILSNSSNKVLERRWNPDGTVRGVVNYRSNNNSYSKRNPRTKRKLSTRLTGKRHNMKRRKR